MTPSPPPPNAIRVARNALTGTGRYAVGAVAALAVTPYVVAVLGKEGFGVWALAGAVLAALRMLDGGLRSAVSREVASAGGDPAQTADLVRARWAVEAALGTAVVIGLSGVALVAALREPLLEFLRVPDTWRGIAAAVVVGTAIVAAVEGLFAPYQAALEGAGRLDIANGIDGVQRLASAAGSVVVLAAGWGLTGLVVKNLITAALAGVAYWRALRRLAPGLVTRPAWRWSGVRRLVRFGRHVQLVNASALAIDPITKAVLARAAGLEAVALFEVAHLVTSQLGGALMAAAAAVFPEAARARQRGLEEVGGLARAAERHVALVAVPVLTLAAVLGRPFVTVWLGDAYREAGTAVTLLALGWLVAVLAVPAFLTAQAAGLERVSSLAGLVTAGVSVAGAVAWAPIGAVGAAAGRGLGLASGGVVARSLAGAAWASGTQSSRVGARLGLAGVACAAAAAVVAFTVTGWPGLIAAGLAGTGAYTAVLAATGELRADDLALAQAVLRGGH